MLICLIAVRQNSLMNFVRPGKSLLVTKYIFPFFLPLSPLPGENCWLMLILSVCTKMAQTPLFLKAGSLLWSRALVCVLLQAQVQAQAGASVLTGTPPNPQTCHQCFLFIPATLLPKQIKAWPLPVPQSRVLRSCPVPGEVPGRELPSGSACSPAPAAGTNLQEPGLGSSPWAAQP